MKKTIFFTISVLLSIGLSAQSFGLKGGISNATAVGGDVDDAESITGIVFGIFTQSGDDAIRYTTELNYVRKGASGTSNIAAGPYYYYYVNQNIKTELLLNYLDLALMGNFHVTDEFAINVGPYAGYLLSGKLKQSSNGQSQSASIDDWEGWNRFEIGGAAGVSYWVNDMFLIDARYAYGFTPPIEDTDVYNGVLQISVGYLFSY